MSSIFFIWLSITEIYQWHRPLLCAILLCAFVGRRLRLVIAITFYTVLHCLLYRWPGDRCWYVFGSWRMYGNEIYIKLYSEIVLHAATCGDDGWLIQFYVRVSNGYIYIRRFTADCLSWWSPIRVLSETDVTLLHWTSRWTSLGNLRGPRAVMRPCVWGVQC